MLAIAALIFLIVFLAVPALQRSQRDTQRRTDVGRLVTSITNYAGNHQGTLPSPVNTAYLNKYLRVAGDTFSDPRLGDYNITAGIDTTTPASSATFDAGLANGVMYYKAGSVCAADGTFTSSGAGARSFGVSIVLESNDIYCQDS